MDDQQVGAAFRALRRRRGLRQCDVAQRADVSQDSVSMVERGRLERVSLPTMRRIAAALDASVTITVRWRGGELYRLLDEEHARLVEAVVAMLRSEGWTVIVEYSYNHFGERGSVDVVGWHPTRRALVVTEVKVRFLDVQDLHAGVDRKVRVVPGLLAGEKGWRAETVGRLVVVRDTPANRAAVARHAQTFASSMPDRARKARRWLRDPAGELAALWFVPLTTHRRSTKLGGHVGAVRRRDGQGSRPGPRPRHAHARAPDRRPGGSGGRPASPRSQAVPSNDGPS